MIATTPASLLNCATELVFSPIFPKFPGLKIALSEGGIGWLPYFLERIDYVHEPPSRLDAPRLPRRQEAQRRVPRARDRLLHRRRGRRAQPRPDRHRQHHLGVRLPALRLDLAERPRGAVALARRSARRGHPQDHLEERGALLSSTTRSSTSRRRSARSARCARRRSTSTCRRAHRRGTPPSDYAQGYCTIGDIMKQMANAFSTPFDNEGRGAVGGSRWRRSGNAARGRYADVMTRWRS